MRGTKSAFLSCVVVGLLLGGRLAAESLWTPGFQGYAVGGGVVAEGDTIVVTFDSDFSLSVESISASDKSLRLELSGGEFGDLFSFLPSGRTGGDRSVSGESAWSIDGRLSGTVTNVDATGLATLQGTRTVSWDGKNEQLSVSGVFRAGDLNQDGTLPFSALAEATLVFQSFVESDVSLLTQADLQRVEPLAPPVEPPVTPLEEEPEEEAAPGLEPQPGLTPEGPGAAAIPDAAQRATYELSEERRQELFLRYVNRLIDILF